MVKQSRQEEIMKMLEEQGEIQTIALSQHFKVSEMTIRRDIDMLSKNAAIIRTRGGAYLAPASQQREPSYTSRIHDATDTKEKIALKATEIMENCVNVFLDSGTSTECILKHISKRKRYMIVTNGINIAQESVNHSQLSTVLIGGDFRTNTLSTTGMIAQEQIKLYRYDIAFLGANAIDDEGNAYVGFTNEAGIKKCIIDSSIQCYILADSSKFSSFNLTSYTNISKISGVITDSGIPEETVEKLRQNGVNVIIAD